MDTALTSINNIFKKTYEELKLLFECNYVLYFYQNKDYKLSLVTNPDWMNIYINNNLMRNCSLIRVGLEKIQSSKNNSVILRWNDISPNSKIEKQINGIRAEFNICNGISFGRNSCGVSDYFGMASDCKNYDFPRNILINSGIVQSLMNNLYKAVNIRLPILPQ